jgi:hypothetical protein
MDGFGLCKIRKVTPQEQRKTIGVEYESGFISPVKKLAAIYGCHVSLEYLKIGLPRNHSTFSIC